MNEPVESQATIEPQVALWREHMAKRPGVTPDEVDELEGTLHPRPRRIETFEAEPRVEPGHGLLTHHASEEATRRPDHVIARRELVEWCQAHGLPVPEERGPQSNGR